MAKTLKIWNGRGHVSGQHLYVAAPTKKDACYMLTMLYRGSESYWAKELSVYWDEGCWGTAMEGIAPERGVWMNKDSDKKPVRLYPTLDERAKDLDVRKRIEAGYYKNTKPFVSIRKDREAWDTYHEEEARMNNLFRQDLAAEHGVTGHPKEQKLFELAWEHGHSSGYSEVTNYYESFVELLK